MYLRLSNFFLQKDKEAINTCNFDMGLGPDGFDGNALLQNKELRHKVAN